MLTIACKTILVTGYWYGFLFFFFFFCFALACLVYIFLRALYILGSFSASFTEAITFVTSYLPSCTANKVYEVAIGNKEHIRERNSKSRCD